MLDGVTGWALFVGHVLTTGTVAMRWLVLPRVELGPGVTVESLRSRTAVLGLAGSAILVVGLGLFFLRQLLEFRDPLSPWTGEASVLLGTSWGRTWRFGMGAALLLAASLGVARRRAVGWWIASPMAFILAAFPALTGHASGAEPSSLFILADALHVVAAGAWIGGLATILWLDFDSRASGASWLPALVPAFSRMATASVATLVVTGSLATWKHLASPSALLTMPWGRLLLVKLIFVAIVMGLGARNFRVLTPKLGDPAGNEAMRRSALAELTVAQVVLLLTALLVRTSPSGG